MYLRNWSRSEILTDSTNPIIENRIELSKLLEVINNRIEKLYDRDHRIGHSYLLAANNITSLKQVWYYQIIPLLLEYFYNNIEKVAEIIGATFIDTKSQKVNSSITNNDFIEGIVKICNNE